MTKFKFELQDILEAKKFEQTQAENTYPKFDSIPRPVLKVIVFIVIFAAAALIRLFIRP